MGTKEFMHRVYFVEEDELSDDISQKYITNHNWDSFPKLNQWVEVLWSDGKTYNGIYKGFRVANCYEVVLIYTLFDIFRFSNHLIFLLNFE